jgi:hypothetical protein
MKMGDTRCSRARRGEIRLNCRVVNSGSAGIQTMAGPDGRLDEI